ncbi:MAG: class I SAM-dependent RNA methyltransferase [Treponema sp.]|jgi:putative N6-adenine-specific DNA methylase|nr:class I SAM-dependent RNA methyltransferase [Treponema sp.]
MTFTAAALCAAGAEKALSNELRRLNKTGAAYTILESGYGRVRFTADLAGIYRALMALRCADRVLLEAGRFHAADFDGLFEGSAAVRWEDYVPRGMGLKVSKVRSNRSRLKAETSIQASVHKAAAQRLCGKYSLNRLPEGRDIVQAELRVYIEKDEASVLLDLSGDPLFKRGYRREGGPAPLRETSAAAVILLSGWKRKFPLYDPLCGSGTIVIEAALYAWNAAPGLGRRFAISHLALSSPATEAAVRDELAAVIDLDREIRIGGSDSDASALALAKQNLEYARRRIVSGGKDAAAGGAGGVSFTHIPLSEAKSELPRGFIITNPPYGKRLGDSAAAEAGYRDMAALSKNFAGWKLAVICDHGGFESHFGKKSDSCRNFKNGALDTFLYEYEKL